MSNEPTDEEVRAATERALMALRTGVDSAIKTRDSALGRVLGRHYRALLMDAIRARSSMLETIIAAVAEASDRIIRDLGTAGWDEPGPSSSRRPDLPVGPASDPVAEGVLVCRQGMHGAPPALADRDLDEITQHLDPALHPSTGVAAHMTWDHEQMARLMAEVVRLRALASATSRERAVLAISSVCHRCGERIYHEIPPPTEGLAGVMRCRKCDAEILFQIEPTRRDGKA